MIAISVVYLGLESGIFVFTCRLSKGDRPERIRRIY